MTSPYKLFFKTFVKYLLILSIPVILLGSFAFTLTYRYVYERASASSIQALEQLNQYNEQMDTLCHSLEQSVNPDTFSSLSLEHILRKDTLDYNDSIRLSLFTSIINSLVNSNPRLSSVYIYWPNETQKVLVSNRGILLPQMLSDTQWKNGYEKELKNTSRNDYIEKREILSSLNISIPVITRYHRIHSLDYLSSNGMLILNIKADNLESYMKNQKLYPGQQLYLTDRSGNLLGATDQPDETLSALFKQLAADGSSYRLIQNNGDYTLSFLRNEDSGLCCLSIIPNKQLYSVPKKLFITTAYLTLLSLFLSLTLAVLYSKKNTRNIHSILNIFSCAKNGKPLPSQFAGNDEYSYIVANLTSTLLQQEQLKNQLKEKTYQERILELVALQTQINPHFLFNTLETIHMRAFGLTKSSNDVTYLIENLSGIMRYTLSDPDQQVSLKQELDYTKAYLNIQKFRYKDKFHIIWEYDDDILDVMVIRLFMQPLIENAIYHGIKEASGECFLKIRLYCRDHYLTLHIIDTGIGMKKEKLMELRESLKNENVHYEHIGLRNTYKRLLLTYTDKVIFQIQSKYDQGTVVTVKFPVS